MKLKTDAAVATFGATAKQKLSNPAASGEPEDQLRAPFEQLLVDMAELAAPGAGRGRRRDVARRPEDRPDYAVTVQARSSASSRSRPREGRRPEQFRDPHDKEQWEKLRSLPNLLYTDGNAFSLWQNGELVERSSRSLGDIETSGATRRAAGSAGAVRELPPLGADPAAQRQRPRPHQRAALPPPARRSHRAARPRQRGPHRLAADWRKLLFPDATDERFADGYAQAVTFGLLMARAQGDPAHARPRPGRRANSRKTNSLIGTALRLLTDDAENQATLKTSLGTLTRVLDAVDWQKISKGKPDAWLYFYEDFLEVYDNDLRKLTGSYYTPPEVVSAMVRLVDEVLRSDRFELHAGLASPAVTLADPAVGTGTFLLGVLRKIAETVAGGRGRRRGPGGDRRRGKAAHRLRDAARPLRGRAAPHPRRSRRADRGRAAASPLRMFVTDTLGNPDDDEDWIPGDARADRRVAAGRRTRSSATSRSPSCIGNPPYKEKAKGRGGWVEGENAAAQKAAPLADVDAAARVGRRARTASTCAISTSTSGAGRRGRCSTTTPRARRRHRLLHHRRRLPQRAGLPEDARLPAAHLRRHLGHRLLARGAPARSGHAHLPGRAAARLHRARLALGEERPERAGEVRFHALPTGPSHGEVRGARRAAARGERLDRLPDRLARAVPAGLDGRVGDVSETRRPLRLQRLGRDAGADVGHRAGRGVAGAALAETCRARPPTRRKMLFHPHLRDGKLGDRHSKQVVRERAPGLRRTTRLRRRRKGRASRRCATASAPSTASGSFPTIA